MKNPSDCQTKDEVRTEIDRLDDQLVELLAARWEFVDRMWQLKKDETNEADVPWRNREVFDRVRAGAEKNGMPADMAEDLWRLIIGWGIQYQNEKLRD